MVNKQEFRPDPPDGSSGGSYVPKSRGKRVLAIFGVLVLVAMVFGYCTSS